MRTGNWEAKKIIDNGIPKVEFSFVISNEKLQQRFADQPGMQGPLRIVKRYWLQKLTPEEITDLDSRSWSANGSYQPSDGQHATHRLRISLPEGQSGLTVGTKASVRKRSESSLQAGNGKRFFVAASAH